MKNTNICKRLFIISLMLILILSSVKFVPDKDINQLIKTGQDVVFTKQIGIYTVSIKAILGYLEKDPVFIELVDVDCTIPRFYVSRWLDEPEYDASIINDGKTVKIMFFGSVRTYIGLTEQFYLNTDDRTVNCLVHIDELISKEKTGDAKMDIFEIIAMVVNILILIFYVAIFILFLGFIIKNKG